MVVYEETVTPSPDEDDVLLGHLEETKRCWEAQGGGLELDTAGDGIKDNTICKIS